MSVLVPDLSASRYFYCVGIGGAGMAPLALYLAQAGHRVSGSDLDLRPSCQKLLTDCKVDLTTTEVLPQTVDCVVYSNAIKPDNPFLQQAQERGLALVKRGHMLAQVASDKKLIAVVGSHGKTTTTALLISAFRANKLPASFILGGFFAQALEGLNAPAYCDEQSEWLIAEVDESDGTIEAFSPDVTLAVNWGWDHPDYYPSPKDWEAALKRLFERTRQALFIPSDCSTLKRLASVSPTSVNTFGFLGDYAGHITAADAEGLSLSLGKPFAVDTVSVPAPGAFNAVNSLAALAVTQYLKGSIVPESLAGFPGVQRRQSRLYHSERLTVYEDYAHHPAEIAALMAFARSAYADRQVLVVFQPHRYSRTLAYKAEFSTALQSADAVFLTEVYSAGDQPQAGGFRADLLQQFQTEQASCSVKSVDTLEELQSQLADWLDKPAILLFVGAGDIDTWAAEYTANLKRLSRVPAQDCWWQALSAQVSPSTVLLENETLADKVTLRTGGSARYYAEPADTADLGHIVRAASQTGVKCFILGRGSNLIVPDAGFDGLVIRLKQPYWKQIEVLPDERIRARSGARLKQICGEACRHGLAGFEFLEGIPGSLGGALRMNAGAMDRWIFERVESVQLLTWEGEKKTIPAEELEVSYRNCPDIARAIALGAVLRASCQEQSEHIRQVIADYASKRRSSQPNSPSAGCIFKNPKDISAGLLIEELGLKGLRQGDAEVSSVHGNFIINRGAATSADILALIQAIRHEAKVRRNIDLEPEALLLGQLWPEDY